MDVNSPPKPVCNYAYMLNVLKTHIAANKIDPEVVVENIVKKGLVNTVVFTRINQAINSPLSSIQQIQLFNIIRRS